MNSVPLQPTHLMATPVYNSQSLPMDNLVMHLDAASLEGYADGSPIGLILQAMIIP